MNTVDTTVSSVTPATTSSRTAQVDNVDAANIPAALVAYERRADEIAAVHRH